MNQKEINDCIIKNQPLIINFAKRAYERFKRNTVLDLDDYIQQANLIAMNCLKKYDSSISKESTYLYSHISNLLVQLNEYNQFPVYVPRFINHKIRKMKKYCRENKKDITDISTDQIKEMTKSDYNTSNFIKTTMELGNIGFSIDNRESFNDEYGYTTYTDIDKDIDDNIRGKILYKALSFETPIDIDIVIDYYKNGKTQKEIGKNMNVSGECIRARIAKVHKHLNSRLSKCKEVLLDG